MLSTRLPRRRAGLGCAAAVASLALTLAAGPADAATRRHSVRLNVLAGVLETRSMAGGGTVSTLAASITGPPFGEAAAAYPLVCNAQFQCTTRFPLFSTRGSITTVINATFAPQQDGSISVNGTARAVGGTGRFRGARGHGIRVAGTVPAHSNVAHLTFRGTLRY